MKNILYQIRWQDILDIGIMSFIIYRILVFLKGTKTLKILISFSLFIFFTSFLTGFFELTTLNWILNNFISSLFLILVILFYPEIRRGFLVMGRGTLIKTTKNVRDIEFIEEIIKTVHAMSLSKIGALIVFQREDDLKEYMEDSTILNAKISKELLLSIFHPATPLHDGAVIISEGLIKAAGCFLPLTTATNLSKSLGTRHRAAIGITEETDCVCLVVSEETGNISVAVDGKITMKLDDNVLEKLLLKLLFGKKRKEKGEKVTQ